MIITYINLDEATSRKQSIEKSFSSMIPANVGWSLSRFSAINSNDPQVLNIEGGLTQQEKACFLSHKTLLISACESDDYHWIVEDDVEFLKPTYNAIKIFIENNLDLDWDILYTDVDFNAVRFMAPVFNFRRELLDGNYTTLQLGGSLYLTASSYIINPKNRLKIKKLISECEINMPWDFFLSKNVCDGKLNAYVTLPFLTKLSNHANYSYIQSSECQVVDLLSGAFRKLMSADVDVMSVEKILDGIDSKNFDAFSRCFGKIVSGFTSRTRSDSIRINVGASNGSKNFS